MEVFRYKRETYKVGLGALQRTIDRLDWARRGEHLKAGVETNMG